MAGRQDVEFKTIDGLTLRGWLFAAAERGPSLIMTPGFNFPRTNLFSNVAERFQREGYTVLLYDPRSTGTSDGAPPNEIDPARQTEDMHDAVSFLKTQRMVDPRRIGVFGCSLSADVALAAAALDRRIRLVIALTPGGPVFGWDDFDAFRAHCMRDRESRVRGNPAYRVPYFGWTGEDDEALLRFSRHDKQSTVTGMADLARIPNFRNQLGFQTYYYMAVWPLLKLLPHVSPTPVLQIDAGDEELEMVKKGRSAVFNAIGEPKELFTQPGKGHAEILRHDEEWEALLDRILSFMEKHFNGDRDE